MSTIWFDMDGTIADFYSVQDWIKKLNREDPSPYEEAKPLCDLEAVARALESLRSRGWRVGVISWMSRGASEKFKTDISRAKTEWLAEYFPILFDDVLIVDYGARKDMYAESGDVLFDDNAEVRKKWRRIGMAYHPRMGILKRLQKL